MPDIGLFYKVRIQETTEEKVGSTREPHVLQLTQYTCMEMADLAGGSAGCQLEGVSEITVILEDTEYVSLSSDIWAMPDLPGQMPSSVVES